MHAQIDLTDPFATAAAALSAGREAARLLQSSLPGLLGHVSPTFTLLAERLERGRILDEFCRHGLETLILRCRSIVKQGTTETTTLVETGCNGVLPIWTPEQVLHRTEDAEEALQALEVLRRALKIAERTHDLAAAETAVMNLRS